MLTISSCLAAYTYFYKDSNYWRFDNHRTEADKGYPRSILKDFMGCVGVPDPKLDPNPDNDQKPEVKPVRPTHPGKEEPTKPNSNQDVETKPDSTGEDEDKEVNVVVTVADNNSKVMTLIMVTVPLVLILCILILIYAILRTLQNKETPRALVHCKRSLQDWVLQVNPVSYLQAPAEEIPADLSRLRSTLGLHTIGMHNLP
ncbi:hypothetical protein XENOCAPTIV_009640 [Xenoophorus captivus]|uniref:Peptidase M10A matrix metallopeptidase C-terminal domain-containing protein n=1 Tax=Xenoophorus captivus TaxID=1517983 RepID=A0ABV0R7X6_9TELE